MWKDFFYFPKSERRGIIVLVGLILLVNVGTYIYSLFKPVYDSSMSAEKVQEFELFIASVTKYDSIRAIKKGSTTTVQSKKLFKFDPNIADSVEFRTLGLNSFVTNNILKYRNKGGRFNKPEDLKRIYGVTPEEYEELAGWITFSSLQKESREITEQTEQTDYIENVPFQREKEIHFKYTSGTKIDLNLADTTELKKIPGIGSGIAGGIVSYRKRLGGFYTVKQLQDLSYIPDSLNKWFFIGKEASLATINLNKASIERLTAHPYLNFYQSKVIVEYRKRKGKLNDLKQLSLYEEFTQEDMERLTPYILFE